MRRLEDNLQESVLLSTMWVPGTQLRSSGLLTSTTTGLAMLLTQRMFFGSRKELSKVQIFCSIGRISILGNQDFFFH